MNTAEPGFNTLPQAVRVRDLIRCAAAVLPALAALGEAQEKQTRDLSAAIRAFDSCITESWSLDDVPVGFDANRDLILEQVSEQEDDTCFIFTRAERVRVLAELSQRGASDSQWEFIQQTARRVALERQAFVRVYYGLNLSDRDEQIPEAELVQSALVPQMKVIEDGVEAAFVKYTGLNTARVIDCNVNEVFDCAGERFVGASKP